MPVRTAFQLPLNGYADQSGYLSSEIESLPTDSAYPSRATSIQPLFGQPPFAHSHGLTAPQFQRARSHHASGTPQAPRPRSSTSRSLRSRSRAIDYVGHPMDEMMRAMRNTISTARSNKSVLVVPRGRSMIPSPTFLPPSNGKRSQVDAKWPPRGDNTVKGCLVRLHSISIVS